MSDYIGYGEMIEQSMLDVVKKTLKKVESDGLKGEHHFYITFLTNHQGVELDKDIKDAHPYDMTIVLQNQFWNLVVTDDLFSVELSFKGVQKKMVIPFDAMLSFNDPSVQFSLHFNMSMYGEEDLELNEPMEPVEITDEANKKPVNKETEVVNLQAFKQNKESKQDD